MFTNMWPTRVRLQVIARSMSTDVNLQPANPLANRILLHSPTAALSRRQIPQRTGLVAAKKGMTGIWDAQGRKQAVTILQLDRTQVTAVKTVAEHGYNAVQIGHGLRQPKNVARAQLGQFAIAKVFPKQHVTEFRTKEVCTLPLATQLLPSHFTVGQFVDVKSVSKGKGFAGVMKRWGFKGLRASHGVSISHRSAGSMGQSQDPGRVLPGKKMAGRLGGRNTTVQNVKIVEINDEEGWIMVNGPIPGINGSIVKLQDAIKRLPTP